MGHLLLVFLLYLPHALGHAGSLSLSSCLLLVNEFLPSFVATSAIVIAILQ